MDSELFTTPGFLWTFLNLYKFKKNFCKMWKNLNLKETATF